MIAAPLFHAWGFAHFTLGMGLSSTIVLKRKFDEEATLSLTAQHGCTALVVVPVMLQRILELDDEILDRYDLSGVKAVPVSGSALPGNLSERWMDHFGDNLYNLYGSTEVAWATIATPQGPARRARDGRQAAARHRRADLRRRGQAGRGGRDRPHLRRQRPPVRGLHRRRQQGRHRRPDVLRAALGSRLSALGSRALGRSGARALGQARRDALQRGGSATSNLLQSSVQCLRGPIHRRARRCSRSSI